MPEHAAPTPEELAASVLADGAHDAVARLDIERTVGRTAYSATGAGRTPVGSTPDVTVWRHRGQALVLLPERALRTLVHRS
jgi:hypothetical protein